MSYLKAVDFVRRYHPDFTIEFGADCGNGLSWKAFQLQQSPFPEPRYVWRVYQDGKCIEDSRDLEPSGEHGAMAYPSMTDAVAACGRYIERTYPDVIFFD